MPPERLLVSVAEAAHMTGLSRGTATKLYLTGQWPSITIGRRRLIVVADLVRWIEERKNQNQIGGATPHDPVRRSSGLGIDGRESSVSTLRGDPIGAGRCS